MKKILLLTMAAFFTVAHLAAQQDCNCNVSIKYRIFQWKCHGKNAAGYPVYSGVLNVGNGPGCTFKLLQVMQQVGGDVSIAMPLTVPPNTIVNTPFTFTDNPPFITAGNSAAFILVFMRGDKKCKTEIISDRLPACTDSACKCNPFAGWSPFTATIKGLSKTVQCGYQFGLTCADTISLKSVYKCIGDCEAGYSAELRNATTGVVVQNYASFGFPWRYQFATPGNYTLVITPRCGDKKCTPCRFFFTVKNCVTACDCNPDGWSKFEMATAGVVKTIKCGEKAAIKKGTPLKLDGKYTCKGSCAVKYTAVLKNSAGAIVQTYPSFSFPFSYHFPVAGVYRLQITPVCGNKKCRPCVVWVSVK